MSDAWLNFVVVIAIQLVLFLVHAWYEKRLREVPKILGWGVLIGLIFGIAFDLIVGKYIGVYSYILGFNATFLIPNGAFSYGFMQANVLLMQKVSFLHFYVWTVVVATVYEITNYFFPVWTWEFATPRVELVIVNFLLYIGISVLMAVTWHVFLGHRFAFIDKALEK